MNKKAILAGLIGNSLFGFSFLFSKVALNYVSPTLLLAFRFDLAFIVLTVLMFLHVIEVDFKKNMKPLILLGILQPVIYFLCENNGLNYLSSSIAGVIIALIPVVSFYTGLIFLKEKFHIRQFMWAIVSVMGVCLISLNSDSSNVSLKGLLLLFGALISAAIYQTLSRKFADTYTSIERTYIMFGIGAITFSAMALFSKESLLVGWHVPLIVSILYLSIGSSIFAFFLINYAVSYLPLRQATSFSSITSVISVLAGIVFLHEVVNLIQVIGIICILIGVYNVNKSTS